MVAYHTLAASEGDESSRILAAAMTAGAAVQIVLEGADAEPE
jgi:hypothetical protein